MLTSHTGRLTHTLWTTHTLIHSQTQTPTATLSHALAQTFSQILRHSSTHTRTFSPSSNLRVTFCLTHTHTHSYSRLIPSHTLTYFLSLLHILAHTLRHILIRFPLMSCWRWTCLKWADLRFGLFLFEVSDLLFSSCRAERCGASWSLTHDVLLLRFLLQVSVWSCEAGQFLLTPCKHTGSCGFHPAHKVTAADPRVFVGTVRRTPAELLPFPPRSDVGGQTEKTALVFTVTVVTFRDKTLNHFSQTAW